MVDDFESRTVVPLREMRLSDCHTYRVAEALPEWSRRDLHTGRMTAFGMPRRSAAPLTELLDIVEREIVPGEMQQSIEQHRSVSGREHEAVAIEPRRIPRVVF